MTSVAAPSAVAVPTVYSADQAPALRLQNVSKRYGSVEAVSNLDLDIKRGEIFGLLGPNGAGKTTTIQMLLGLTAASSGKISVLGFDPYQESLKVRANTGLVLQQSALDAYLSGWQNLQLHADLYPMPKRQRQARIREGLAWAGLSEAASRLVRTYSGGMKRRLDLAISTLHRPELLVLDEPTLGLDIHTRKQLWTLIQAVKQKGTTVLLTTHYLEEANQLCDRVGILNQGKLVALGTPEALRRATVGDTHRLRVTLKERPEGLDLPLRPVEEGETFVFTGEPNLLWRTLAALQQSCANSTTEVTYQQPTLDDVFLSLTQEEADHA